MISERAILFGSISLVALVFHVLWLHLFRDQLIPRLRPLLISALGLQQRRYHDYESAFWRHIDPIDRIYSLKKLVVVIIELCINVFASLSPWLIVGMGVAIIYGAIT